LCSKSRLKSIVEDKGYKLVGESKVVDGDDLPKPATASPLKKFKPKKQKATDKGLDGEATKAAKVVKSRKRKATDSTGPSKPKPTKKQKQKEPEQAASAERESLAA